MPALTAEERISKLRGFVNGTPTATRAGTSQSKPSLLTGVALHALTRQRKGKTDLSLIERLSTGLFEVVADDEQELDAYAEVVTQAKADAKTRKSSSSAVSSSGWLPQSILDLPNEEPYSNEHFKADVAATIDEVISKPNCRVVDPATGPDATSTSDDEFDAAMAETGRATTLFWSDRKSPRAGEAAVNASSKDGPRVRLIPKAFECLRRSNEVGHDEIYWSFSSGADTNEQLLNKYYTDEFGKVSTGYWGTFSDYVIFDGVVGSVLSAHIVCWEADHSNSEWYDKLITMARAASRISKEWSRITGHEVLDELLGQLPGYDMRQEVLMWVELIADLIANFLKLFRNEDDKVAEHKLAWNLPALNELYANNDHTMSVMFDGGSGGKHKLHLQRVFEVSDGQTATPVVFYSGVDSAQWDGSNSPSYMRLFHGVSMAVTPSNQMWYAMSYPTANHPHGDELRVGTDITTAAPVGWHRTRTRPSITANADGVYVVYRDNEERIRAMQRLPVGHWISTMLAGSTPISPSVCVFKDYVVAMHYGYDGSYHWAWQKRGQGWSSWTKIRNIEPTPNSPGICAKGDRLYIFYTTTNALMHVAYMTDNDLNHSPGYVADSRPISPLYTQGAVSATLRNNKIWIAFRHLLVPRASVVSYNEASGSIDEYFYDGPDGYVYGDPQVCNNSGRLHLSFTERW